MFAWVLSAMGGCWFTDEELSGAAAGVDSAVGTVVGAEGCAEGGSSPASDGRADYTAAAGILMVGLPSGTFCMGSQESDAESDEAPLHAVTLTEPFWIGKSEVTQAQYEVFTGDTPSRHAACGDCPVEYVSWHEAVLLANAVSDAEALERCYTTDAEPESAGNPYDCEGYRLPTEAEWEYAARGGESSPYAGSDDPTGVAWTSENADGDSHAVCGLGTNGFGLCDMGGNVYEWTADAYDEYSAGPAADPVGTADGLFRAYRGGSWSDTSRYARVAARAFDQPVVRWYDRGFRLARSSP